MSEQPTTDCGHSCCDTPYDPTHDHFLDADVCGQCAGMRAKEAALRAEVAAQAWLQATFEGSDDQ